jgi:hypothetical protein
LNRRNVVKKDLVIRLAGIGLAALLVSSVASAAGPFQFYSITPCRIVDTRGPVGPTGGPVMAGDTQRDFPIDVPPTACGIPTDAAAAVLNFVVVAPGGGGHLRVWPFGLGYPGVATLNFDPGEPAIANGAITPLTVDTTVPITDPQISVMVKLGSASLTSHLVIDATGYFK